MDLRLFIAIELPDEWIDALRETQQILRRHGLERLRWVRAEGIHLTLKFLGETSEEQVTTVEQAMTRAAASRPPFRLRLAAPSTFGSPRRPWVVWAGVDGDLSALRTLQTAIERETTASGFAPTHQTFSPHLTLARVPERPEPGLPEVLTRALTRAPAGNATPLLVREITLFRSELNPDGARYQRLSVVPLAQTAE